MIHQPKGGMCATCVHALRDCTGLDFKSMQPIKKQGIVVIVRCTDFERKAAK